MPKKRSKPQKISSEDVKQLRADRDDALGYSREQFTFDKKKRKKARPTGKKK